MIFELLNSGRENATSGQTLCKYFACDIRTITAQIERERLAGAPICAATNGSRPGYFLAANQEEINDYCNSLRHRASQIFRTRQALLNARPVPEKDEEAEEQRGPYYDRVQELVKETAKSFAGNIDG